MGIFDASYGHGRGPASMPQDEKARRNELIFQCIMSDQVPEDELGVLMEDPQFRAYFEQRIRLVRDSAEVPPHAAGLLSGLATWFQGWRKGGGVQGRRAKT